MKHERAAIMALTFCIGFTTALIAYGIPAPETDIALTVPAAPQTANVISADTAADVSGLVESRYSYVETDEGGLYVVIDGERLLVSPSEQMAPGLAESHIVAHSPIVSRDARFVFFCAETISNSPLCAPRIFDLASFSVHPVPVDGRIVAVDPSTVQVAWTSDNRLQFNQRVSVSAESPWLVR